MKNSIHSPFINLLAFVLTPAVFLFLGACADDVPQDIGDPYAEYGTSGYESTAEGETTPELPDRDLGSGKADFDPDRDLDMEVFRAQMIHFDFDKYNIRPSDRPNLEAIAQYMKANPDSKIYVIGHCDERGTLEYNRALGERRANSAREYLIGLGIQPSRIGTLSFGSERPIDPAHTEAAYAKNRRDEFGVLKK